MLSRLHPTQRRAEQALTARVGPIEEGPAQPEIGLLQLGPFAPFDGIEQVLAAGLEVAWRVEGSEPVAGRGGRSGIDLEDVLRLALLEHRHARRDAALARLHNHHLQAVLLQSVRRLAIERLVSGEGELRLTQRGHVERRRVGRGALAAVRRWQAVHLQLGLPQDQQDLLSAPTRGQHHRHHRATDLVVVGFLRGSVRAARGLWDDGVGAALRPEGEHAHAPVHKVELAPARRVVERRAALHVKQTLGVSHGCGQLEMAVLVAGRVVGDAGAAGVLRTAGDGGLVHGGQQEGRHQHGAARGRGVGHAGALLRQVLPHEDEPRVPLERGTESLLVVIEGGAEGRIDSLVEDGGGGGGTRLAAVAALELERGCTLPTQLTPGADAAREALHVDHRQLATGNERRHPSSGAQHDADHLHDPAQLVDWPRAIGEEALPRQLALAKVASRVPLALERRRAPLREERRSVARRPLGDLDGKVAHAQSVAPLPDARQPAAHEHLCVVATHRGLGLDDDVAGVGESAPLLAHARLLLEPGDRLHLLLHGREQGALDPIAKEDEGPTKGIVPVLEEVGALQDDQTLGRAALLALLDLGHGLVTLVACLRPRHQLLD